MFVCADNMSEMRYAVRQDKTLSPMTQPLMALVFGLFTLLVMGIGLFFGANVLTLLMIVFSPPFFFGAFIALYAGLVQRSRPDWVPKGTKAFLTLETTGNQLEVIGLAGFFSVLNRTIPLAGLDVSLQWVPRTSKASNTSKWRLLLTPEDGQRLELWTMRCTAKEASQIVAALQKKIAWAEDRQGEGEADIPASLKGLSERTSEEGKTPSPPKLGVS